MSGKLIDEHTKKRGYGGKLMVLVILFEKKLSIENRR